MNILNCLFVLLYVMKYVKSANILYLTPFTSKSHLIALRPLGLELARRGHNVTVITPIKEKNPLPNYHEVISDDKPIWDVLGIERPNIFTMIDVSFEEFQNLIHWNGGLAMTELALNSTSVKEFLKKDNTFDLVISEQFYQEALSVLAYKYNAVLALVTTYGNCVRHNLLTGNPLQLPTVVGEHLQLSDPTSFLGRLTNLYYTIYDYVGFRYFYLKKQEQLVKKYMPEMVGVAPSLYEIQKNAALMLINSHFSYDTPAAYLPNIVEVGGLHLSNEGDLPKDLQKILDDSKNGFVYLNFGSQVRISELPIEKRNAFLEVFRSLKQKVLLKWEHDELEGKSPNVIIRKWFPQKEILAHKNIKCFISHGGLIGTHEAIYHGVPVIGVPVYADQFNNVLQLQEAGVGKLLRYHDINEETLRNILNAILYDDSYMKNAKELSRRFKDRPMSPLDTAVFWLEYVIRNKGAEYMKNPARNLSFIAYNMLDVYIFIALVILVLLIVIVKILLLVKSLFSNKGVKKQKLS